MIGRVKYAPAPTTASATNATAHFLLLIGELQPGPKSTAGVPSHGLAAALPRRGFGDPESGTISMQVLHPILGYQVNTASGPAIQPFQSVRFSGALRPTFRPVEICADSHESKPACVSPPGISTRSVSGWKTCAPGCRSGSRTWSACRKPRSTDDAFPRGPLEDLGYNLAIHGQKTFNGVAILSKYPFDAVTPGLPGEDTDDHARFIEAVVSQPSGVVRVACLYLPNGNPVASEKYPYKLRWMDRLRAYAHRTASTGRAAGAGRRLQRHSGARGRA